MFSKYPNSFGFGSYNDDDLRYSRDNEVFVPLENVRILPIEIRPDRSMIYQYDPIETYFHDIRLKERKKSKVDLTFARQVIADEHYPTHGEYWFNPVLREDEWTGEERMEDSECMEWGRWCLLDLIAACRHNAAIPELREIILHDDSRQMRTKALRVLGVLDQKKASQVVNEALKFSTDRFFIMEVTHYIRNNPSKLFIPNLREKFEEYYLDYTNSPLARRYFCTIPQSILIYACARIPTLSSLEIIELGLKHPYPHVESHASHALHWWLERIVKQKVVSERIFKKVSELRHKYDFGNTEAWKAFKKLPIAGPY